MMVAGNFREGSLSNITGDWGATKKAGNESRG